MAQRFFTADPIIKFTKINCPFCKKPTGTDTGCEALDDDSKLLVDETGMSVNVYSTSCVYRQNCKYIIDINYPVNAILITRIQSIPGINNVFLGQTHKFHVDISPIFNESDVKKQIATVYRGFCKEMQTHELNLMLPATERIKPKVVRVTMPNGVVSDIVLDSPSQEAVLQEIKDNYPNARFEEL